MFASIFKCFAVNMLCGHLAAPGKMGAVVVASIANLNLLKISQNLHAN